MKQINFFKGYASTNLIPRKEINEAYSHILTCIDLDQYNDDPDNQHPLNYGTDPGNLSIRNSIAQFLGRHFQRPPSDPHCFNLTNGASFGIGVILNRCTDLRYTERIFIVSPCYFLVNPVFVDHGYGDRISSVNETPDGEFELDLVDFERQLLQLSPKSNSFDHDICGRPNNKLFKGLLYIVPTYSNPGSLTYSMKTRTKLIELARKYDILIVCDDVYDLLKYDDQKLLPRLVYLDRDTLPETNLWGNVISNSSTSKLLAPGLRFGWHETPRPNLALQLSQDGCTISGGTASQLNSYVVQRLIDTNKLDDIIKNYIFHYSTRVKTAIRAINTYLPNTTQVFGGQGGYFLWIRFDKSYNLPEIIKTIQKEKNIIFAGGDAFEVVNNKQGWSDSIRLCFSFLTEEEIEAGIKELGNYFK